MKEIISVQNAKVKQWRKLHHKKGRVKSNMFLMEGYHLVEEALKSDWKVHELIISEDIVQLPEWIKGENIYQLRSHVFEHICQTENPQGIAAVLETKWMKPVYGARNLLLLDRIQDPGNLGTIIRTADACGFDGIILGSGTVDVFNDKVIRSTQGSIFHIAIEQADLSEKMKELQKDGYSIWATALRNSQDYQQIKPTEKIALLLGNEGSGVQDTLLRSADEIARIPIYGKAESLNVSVAAGILMYHVKHIH
ncbi:TrmH family RNA methyltransferase [Virgibacillus halophilus]